MMARKTVNMDRTGRHLRPQSMQSLGRAAYKKYERSERQKRWIRVVNATCNAATHIWTITRSSSST